MKSKDKAVELSAQTTRNVFKRNLTRFAAVLLVALAGLVAVPNAALAAPQHHHDQQPGFYRLKVGDLEVTALYDGTGVFDPHWLNGTKATMDGVVQALQEDPHMLDVVDMGFLVHTGKQLILAASAAQATRRNKSTSFWSRTSIPITSAASRRKTESGSFPMPMFTSPRPKATPSDPAAGSKPWAPISVERLWASWDLGTLDHRLRGLG